MACYNGFPSYNAWNISLWINNDEGFYDLMRRCIKRHDSRKAAAVDMLYCLAAAGTTKTPDGVLFTKTNIQRAMVGAE